MLINCGEIWIMRMWRGLISINSQNQSLSQTWMIVKWIIVKKIINTFHSAQCNWSPFLRTFNPQSFSPFSASTPQSKFKRSEEDKGHTSKYFKIPNSKLNTSDISFSSRRHNNTDWEFIQYNFKHFWFSTWLPGMKVINFDWTLMFIVPCSIY